ncbi:MAG: Lrp/AsnC family transcriptional regulator [Candidatus Bathyarchaeaceae archaeon]
MSERSVKAYFVATVKRGTEHEVAERIRKMKEVKEVLVTYGLWDIVARIEAESLGHLDKIITEIRKIPEIEQTNTLIGA